MPTTAGTVDDLFATGGEMGALMRTLDWAATPVGPAEAWPQSLRTAVSICLMSRFPMLIWWGPELVMLYNDAYAPIIAAKHPRALGAPGRAIFPEIWDVIGPMLASVVERGQATYSEDQLLLLDRNGYVEECYFTFSYSPILDESGGVGGIFTAVTETTGRVLSERRLRTLRELAASTADAHSQADAATRALDALGVQHADVPFALLYLRDHDGGDLRLAGGVGLRVEALTASDAAAAPPAGAGDLAGAIAAVREAAERTALANEAEVLRGVEALAEGASGPAPREALAIPVARAGQERPYGVLVAGVNPRRALDEEYRGFFGLVAGQIATALASAQSYEEERRRAEALAELDRAKTAFFSNVSHEFRTPLTLLLGPLADALDDTREPLAAGQRERLEVAQRNGLRLLKLVNSLLDFSRIEAGRMQASYESVELAALTAEVAGAFRSLIEHAGLRFAVDCPPLAGLAAPVYVDRDLWEKIVLNLLSNAFKFTFAGEIGVSLRTVEGGRAVELAVRDTGTGIPPEELPRIFERFHRVEGARSRTFEGSGIGLALVRELVLLHGGEIAAESAVGEGTTFRVRIPTGAAHLPAERVRAPRTQASTAVGAAAFVEEAARWLPDVTEDAVGGPTLADGAAGGAAGGAAVEGGAGTEGARSRGDGARIVVADDNADMRDYLARLLGGRYRVATAPDGAAALAEVRARGADLVLADVMMPGMDGFALVRALKDDPATADVPVVVLSARAGEEATAEGMARGADDYLVKPFSARELLARVEARLELARLRSEAVARARELEITFEAITDAIFIYDREGRIARMNSAARALFGLDAVPDYAGGSPEERATLIHVCDEQGRPMPAEMSGLYKLLRGESLTGANAQDVRLRLPDGRELEVSITGAPLLDATGAVAGAIAVSRDVTERRRLEREVAEQAARLEAVFNAITDGVFVYDRDQRLVQANTAARRINPFVAQPGYLARPFTERIADFAIRDQEGTPIAYDDLPVARVFRGETLTGMQAFDTTIRQPDGREVILNTTGAPVYDAEGRVQGAVIVTRDVTERHRLERRTREALDALLAMAEAAVQVSRSADDGTGAGTGTGTGTGTAAGQLARLAAGVLGCERVAMNTVDVAADRLGPLAIVGVTPQQEAQWYAGMAGAPLSAFLEPEHIRQLRAGEAFFLDLTPAPRSDFSYGVPQALITPMRVGDELVGILSVGLGAAAHRFTGEEVALAGAVARLGALVIERERLLHERAAAEARALALDEANRRMDEFLGVASHELRTPLTSVIANVQMAERRVARQVRGAREDEPRSAEALGRAHDLLVRTERQLGRLNRLVGDLVDVSRITAGKLDFSVERGDLREVVRDAVEGQRASWPHRRITLDLPRGALPTLMDADRIGQVVTNYLTNALKYSPDETPVAVRVRTRDGAARVEVRDQGPGLPPDQHERIWERFHRVPGIEQQSGSGVGLGLGLHICREIVGRHGGAVGVESAPGAGSTFWFTLPLDG